MALTGEVADGTILVAGLTPTEVSEQGRRVRHAHAAAARADDVAIVAYVTAAFGDGAKERVSAESGDSETADDRGVWGDPDDVAAAVQRFAATGADAVVLVAAGGEPDLHEFLHAVGEVARLGCAS